MGELPADRGSYFYDLARQAELSRLGSIHFYII
jgi:hypothetical protein